MTYTVTVTSQGQISIPAPIRRKMRLNKRRKMIVELKNDQTIELRPIQDFSELAGVVKTTKKVSYEEARGQFEEYMSNWSKWKDI
ncbi:AbrB/MazE/SpoVT family DNA-binding domain-containing protein [Candidatus Collierbacteria bacterium]|nr:AbrB/MazE/SpoVT family DNA-binding domain-containing protein [Candidatus Collierbacteria bacterium]